MQLLFFDAAEDRTKRRTTRGPPFFSLVGMADLLRLLHMSSYLSLFKILVERRGTKNVENQPPRKHRRLRNSKFRFVFHYHTSALEEKVEQDGSAVSRQPARQWEYLTLEPDH